MIQDISHIIESYAIQNETGVEGKEGHIFKDLQDGVTLFESEEFPGQFETDVLCFADPRTNLNGVRVLCAKGSLELEEGQVKYFKTQEEYDMYRYLLGLPEGSKECGGQFPLHLNFQQLNGVSTNKGCYIGQELIQRTTHLGTLRKQVLPFIFNKEGEI